MVQFLGLLLLSFFITSFLIVPFIDLLYKIKFTRRRQKTKDIFERRTPVFDKFHSWKTGTPVGGGILLILIVSLLSLWAHALLGIEGKFWEIFVLLFTFLSFGILGFVDDLLKFFVPKGRKFFGLRFQHKLLMQLVLGVFIGLIFYFKLKYNFLFIHWIGKIDIGPLFIPFTALTVTFLSNAFNITDGLDGLSCGLLIICLFAFIACSWS